MLIIALIMACLSDIAFAGEWTKKADTPVEILQSTAVVFKDEIYIFGGPHGGNRNTVKYNPATDTWIKLADMPNSRQGCMSVEVNGLIYVFGNIFGMESSIDVYNPIKNSWESKSKMPNRGLSSYVSIGDKIYIFGGIIHPNTYFDEVIVYDTKNDIWEKKQSMPKVIADAEACFIDGKIYIFGGSANNPFFQDLSSVWEFDPIGDKWEKKTDMPTAREDMTIALIDGMIYAMGGWNFNTSELALDTFDVYNILSDKWGSTEKMPCPVGAHAFGVVNKRIYTIGGILKPQGDIYRFVYEYNPFPQPTTSVSPKESLIGTWGSIKSGK